MSIQDSSAMMRKSLAAFTRAMMPDFKMSWHHKMIIQKLTLIEEGKLKRLIISAPPRHSKSLLVAEMLPPWFIGKNPKRQVIYSTYGDSLSKIFGRRVKGYMQSEAFKMAFPECKLRQDSQASDIMETTRRGVYVSTSIGGSVTGKGADILIVDDFLKDRQEADSALIRDRTWDWYTSTARTRLQPGGAIVVMATRWHEDDLIGRILDKAEPGEWEVISLPALSENGVALWPDWVSEADLHSIRREIGEYDFESLYQGNPVPKKGGVINTDRINRVKELKPSTRIIMAVDSAVKEGKENDYNVLTAWSYTEGRVQIHDIVRKKAEYPELKRMVKLMADRWKPVIIGVEDKSSGQQIIQEMTDLPIKALKAVSDKKVRAQAFADLVDAGLVDILDDAPYTDNYFTELKSFPSGKHDDQVDASSHAATMIAPMIYANAFSDSFDIKRHLVDVDFKIPLHWDVYRSMHYPDCVVWWTVVTREHIKAAKDTIIIIDEMEIKPRQTPEEVAKQIKKYELKNGLHDIDSGPAGGKVDLFKKNGPKLINHFIEEDCSFIQAFDNMDEGYHHMLMKLSSNKLVISRSCGHVIDNILMATLNEKKSLENPGPFLRTMLYICHAYSGGYTESNEVDIVDEFEKMEKMFMGSL